MRQATLALMAMLAACGPSAGEDEAPPAANQSAPAPLAGCADKLIVDADRDSFLGAGIGAGQADIDRWSREGGAAFKAAAARLCAEGKLPPAELAPFGQLLIQYGGGADSAAIWVDDARPSAIILQYAFFPGSPAPSVDEVGEALTCWSDPDRPVCMERMP